MVLGTMFTLLLHRVLSRLLSLGSWMFSLLALVEAVAAALIPLAQEVRKTPLAVEAVQEEFFPQRLFGCLLDRKL
jgi:hypothetical protein